MSNFTEKRKQQIEERNARLVVIRSKMNSSILDKISYNQRLHESELKEYYNTKHPTQNIVYKSRYMPGVSGQMFTDIKNFITTNNFLIDGIVSQLGTDSLDLSFDEKAEIIQKWVIDSVSYRYDQHVSGYLEFWQFPFETISLGTGDCEDGAVLMASLMIASGIPNYRVRVAGGLVATGQPSAPTGGHGWCCYLRQTDNKWIPLDWCYLPELGEIKDRVTIKDNDNYLDTWFSWNDEYSWGRESIELENRLKN